jgi:hypothetical protein
VSDVNRIQKVLDAANIRLASVASNGGGVSGLAILRAHIAGPRRPKPLPRSRWGRQLGA